MKTSYTYTYSHIFIYTPIQYIYCNTEINHQSLDIFTIEKKSGKIRETYANLNR